MDTPPIAIPPLLIRNILTSLFIHADKSLLNLSEKYKPLLVLRCLLVSAFLFLLRLLPFVFPSLNPSDPQAFDYPLKPPKSNNYASATAAAGGGGGGGGDSGIARAMSQLLSIVNDIPVSSRKYEVVRSLAERLIDENLSEGSEALREVNCSVLSAAFSRALSQLQAAVVDRDRTGGDVAEGSGEGGEREYRKVGRVLRAVRYYGDAALTRFRKAREEPGRWGGSAEKLAAEVLWLAQKMAACGCAEEAVGKWASASHLAWLALSAEPRLQGSLVKVSAFLFKQARDLGRAEEEDEDEGKKEQQRQTKMKMLMSWLPLLCRASIGTDEPVLNMRQRSELERVLEETIETLEREEEQENVLSLWLHHFTHCPSSDWPNLHACYARWCNASRKLLLLQ
ncbi:uncharacterized protein LOC130778914 [Actinidia eriantha]|uniref:uncharacterized protein LOC130778914 n=1 Tax=Actinidia eriantha TaxID=165200 RepID=UPI0025893B16|nr:uncharacterized protein LOC130778914 [Actinidia eriantha]